MPKVSVIIPVYNVEKYLEKCLESIVGQTLRDIEIICVNDGATDNSPVILEKYAKNDPRIKIVNKLNGGLPSARNAGLEVATGEFIGFIDSDDWIDLDFYEKLYDAANKNQAEIAATGIIRKNEKKHKIRLKFTETKVYETFEDKVNVLDALRSPSVWNKIYKRDFLNRIALKFQNVRYYEDGYFTVNALYYCNKMAIAPNTNYYYFINPTSIVRSGKTKRKVYDKIMGRNYIVNFVREKCGRAGGKDGSGAKIKDWTMSAETFRLELFGLTLFSVKESFYSKKVYLFALIPIWQIKNFKTIEKLKKWFKKRQMLNELANTSPCNPAEFQDCKNFILYNYGTKNLGDYMQTLATKHCLDTIFKDATYTFFDRDMLFNLKNTTGICVFQGWYAHKYYFLPKNNILPVFVGTHLAVLGQKLFKKVHSSNALRNKEIGCRDNHTVKFCQKLGISSYLSRCLTLTLPKREPKESQNKVFFVDVSEEIMKYIPEAVKNDAVFAKQRNVDNIVVQDFENNLKMAQNLIGKYKNEARLIITSALHVASPCIAMGIPTILIQTDNEAKLRFGSLDNIMKIHKYKDFKDGLVDFNGYVPDIEELKKLLIKNLELSIKKELGQDFDNRELKKVREKIAKFNAV